MRLIVATIAGLTLVALCTVPAAAVSYDIVYITVPVTIDSPPFATPNTVFDLTCTTPAQNWSTAINVQKTATKWTYNGNMTADIRAVNNDLQSGVRVTCSVVPTNAREPAAFAQELARLNYDRTKIAASVVLP